MSEYSRNNNDIKLQIEHDNHIAILSDDQDWVIDYVIDIKDKEILQLKQQLSNTKTDNINWMNKNKQLKQQLEEANKSFNSLHKIMDRGQEENYRLKQQLEEAVEVIEFYGNRFSWNFSQHPDHEYYAGAIKDDDSLLKYKEKNGDEFEDYCGGKRARQFLAKYRGEK